MNGNYVPTTHAVPKCTCCGAVGQTKPGPLLRSSDWLWLILLFIFGMVGGFVYLIFILMIRGNPKKREQICTNCGAKNMFTYLY